MFTALILWNLMRSLVLYAIVRHASPVRYFYTYWSLGIVDVLLQIGIFVEIAAQTFRPLGRWAPDVRRGFLWMVSASLLVAALLTWWDAPLARRPIAILVSKGDFFFSALLSELLLGTLILSTWAGLAWKTHVARISQGLGIYSALGLITGGSHSLKLNQGTILSFVWGHLLTFSYVLCLGYWIVTLWRDAPLPRELPEKLRSELARLNRMLSPARESL